MRRRKLWRARGLLFALLAVAGISGRVEAQSFRDEAMMAKLLLRYRQFKAITQDIHGKITITADGVNISADMEASVKMAQPDRFRFETKMTLLGQERSGATISDGKTVWEWDEDAHQYSALPLAPISKNKDKFTDWLTSRSNADLTPVLFFEGASGKLLGVSPDAGKSIEVKDYPTRQIDGRTLYVIPVPINDPDGTKGEATLYVDVDDMLVHRCRYMIKPPREKGGPKQLRVDFVLTYDKIITDASPTDDDFVFKVPDGAKQVKAVKPVFDRIFQ